MDADIFYALLHGTDLPTAPANVQAPTQPAPGHPPQQPAQSAPVYQQQPPQAVPPVPPQQQMPPQEHMLPQQHMPPYQQMPSQHPPPAQPAEGRYKPRKESNPNHRDFYPPDSKDAHAVQDGEGAQSALEEPETMEEYYALWVDMFRRILALDPKKLDEKDRPEVLPRLTWMLRFIRQFDDPQSRRMKVQLRVRAEAYGMGPNEFTDEDYGRNWAKDMQFRI